MCAHIWLPSTRTVRLCIKENSASRLRLQNPCQFCGQEYKRRDAHLRSCIGVFNGVYLHRRVARGKALSLSGASPCDPLSSTDVRATGTTHADRAHACHPRTEPFYGHGGSPPDGVERGVGDRGPPGAAMLDSNGQSFIVSMPTRGIARRRRRKSAR